MPLGKCLRRLLRLSESDHENGFEVGKIAVRSQACVCGAADRALGFSREGHWFEPPKKRDHKFCFVILTL